MGELPFLAAIVGSGPSGFFAAEALLDSIADARVDMFERLPTPFGLVRSGVAPDHPQLKKVTEVFDRIMRSDRVQFVGNVEIGKDIGLDTLRAAYHIVILAYGAGDDRKMGIPGEDLANCHSAKNFVGWYNGHPDFRNLTFDLSREVAVVVGQGNVAADVSRMLLQPAEALNTTDIASHALEALRESRVREVHVVGRRGPAQAKFTPKELRGLGEIQSCTASTEHSALGDACEKEIADRRNINAKTNLEFFQTLATPVGDERRRLLFRFCLDPASIEGDGRVERFVFKRSKLEGKPFEQRAVPTGETVTIDCGLVFTSIGYRGTALDHLPFDKTTGTIPSNRGRIGSDAPGVYVTGWLKRGPTGIIGTNRADSIETVKRVLEDFPTLSAERRYGFDVRTKARQLNAIDLADWDGIDALERAKGRALDKPREKFTRVAEMLAACGRGSNDARSDDTGSTGTRQSLPSGSPAVRVAVRS